MGVPEQSGIQAPAALLPDGWATNVCLYWNSEGFITSVKTAHSDANLPSASGPIIPGMINIHSHAFQRELVGRTQSFTSPSDDFWSWREAMYEHLSTIGPDNLENIATELYGDMIAAGYTSVCEFHYVHCGPEGDLYADPDAMSIALLNAATATGIGLTLLPVYYEFGGFGEQPIGTHQNRFVLSLGDYLDLVARLLKKSEGNPQVSVGYAPHSLRAVNARGIHQLLDHRAKHTPTAPVHIHVAEQMREVEECMAILGKRPIEYLYDKAPVDEYWCLIHSTHASPDELALLAASGAVVGLCPTTEADLGDGVFPLPEFLELGGSVAIGSDSNLCVSPFEELRLLEYMQRLRLQKRNVEGITSALGSGTRRYLQSLSSSITASGRKVGRLAPNNLADFLVLDTTHALLRDRTPDEMLNSVVYSCDPPALENVYIQGRAKRD